jgi:hypothetical protein
MNDTVTTRKEERSEACPAELKVLKERIQNQPARVRAELEPLIDEVLEHAMFRSRVMLIAREALQRFRVDLAATRFDLDLTRRERRSHCA